MRFQLCLIGAAIVLIGASALCAYFAIPQPSQTVEVAEAALDLGELRQGQTVSGSFELINRFRQPIDIIGTQESCGCSTVALDVMHLEPNQRAILKAQWKTGTSRGAREIFIRVFYKLAVDGTRFDLPLTMRGDIAPDIDHDPKEVVCSAEMPSTQKVKFRPGALKTGTVESPYASHRAVTVKSVGDQEVEVTFDPAQWKNAQGLTPYFAVKTNSPNEPILRIFINVQKASEKQK